LGFVDSTTTIQDKIDFSYRLITNSQLFLNAKNTKNFAKDAKKHCNHYKLFMVGALNTIDQICNTQNFLLQVDSYASKTENYQLKHCAKGMPFGKAQLFFKRKGHKEFRKGRKEA
jgi:hypothetical protein